MSACPSTVSPAPPRSPSSSGSGPATTTPSWWRRSVTGSSSGPRPGPWPTVGWPSARRAGSTPRWPPCAGSWSTRGRWSPPTITRTGRSRPRRSMPGGAEVYIGLRLDAGTATARPRTTPGTATPRRAGADWPNSSRRDFHRPSTSPTEGSRGMSLPLLRETRMPAVIVRDRPGQRPGRAGRHCRPGRGVGVGRVGRQRAGIRRRTPTVNLCLTGLPACNPQPHAQVVDYALPPIQGIIATLSESI